MEKDSDKNKNANNPSEETPPKPIPMKKIGLGLALLFGAWVFFMLIMPGFFDTSPFGMLFKQGPAPWAISDEENAKFQFSEAQLQGRYHFQNYCASCHGPEGKGNGVMANNLTKRPPSFMNPNENYKNGLGAEGVRKTLQEGIPDSPMQSFSYLKEDVKDALVEYVHYLNTHPGLF